MTSKKERNDAKCVCSKQRFSIFPIYKRVAKTISMVMLLCKHGRWIFFYPVYYLAIIFEFSKSSKVKLLRTDPFRSSTIAARDFEMHVEGKRTKKDSERNRNIHKDTSAAFPVSRKNGKKF